MSKNEEQELVGIAEDAMRRHGLDPEDRITSEYVQRRLEYRTVGDQRQVVATDGSGTPISHDGEWLGVDDVCGAVVREKEIQANGPAVQVDEDYNPWQATEEQKLAYIARFGVDKHTSQLQKHREDRPIRPGFYIGEAHPSKTVDPSNPFLMRK